MAFIRERVGELMDDPMIDPVEHENALVGLWRLQRLCRTSAILSGHLLAFARNKNLYEISILDIACGRGDVMIDVAKRCQQSGLRMRLVGVDISETALTIARQRARDAGVEAEYIRRDVLKEELPSSCDVVTSSLFLHHLDPDDVRHVLKSAQRAALRLVLIDDLHRSAFAYYMTILVTGLVTRSHIVHIDGPRSVQAAYTCDEMMQLCIVAGLENAQVSRHFPQRLLIQSEPH